MSDRALSRLANFVWLCSLVGILYLVRSLDSATYWGVISLLSVSNAAGYAEAMFRRRSELKTKHPLAWPAFKT